SHISAEHQTKDGVPALSLLYSHKGNTMKKIITAVLVAVATFTPFAVEAAPNPYSTVTGGLNIPGLTASQCIATDANKNLVSTGAACGTGSVTAVTGSGNISSSGGAT